MKCIKCHTEKIVKNGFTRGQQRYKCNQCKYNFTLVFKRRKPQEIKRLALHMYLEGLGFRSIGRILKVSNTIVLSWINNASETIKHNLPKKCKIIELDEMWHYKGKKNNKNGYGLLLIELQKELSHFKLAIVEQKLCKNYGKKLKT